MGDIEFIEPNNIKEGLIDFSLINEYIQDLNEEIEQMDVLLDKMNDIENEVISAKNDAGLQTLNLTVSSFDDSHIVFTGTDTSYKYLISVFDSENGVFIVCLRIDEASKTFEKYDYFEKKWVEIKVFTDEQLKIMSDTKDFAKKDVIETYNLKFGNLTDTHLKMLLSKNKEIIELYKKTHRFTYIDMLDKNTIAIHPSSCDGTMIYVKNGEYHIDAEVSFSEHFYVDKLNSKEKVLQILNEIFDKYLVEYNVVIPLSNEAFAAVSITDDKSDDYEVDTFFTSSNRNVINADEKAVLEKYIDACMMLEDNDGLLL